MTQGVSALPLIGSSYISYDKLTTMTSYAFSNNPCGNATAVNIYIDLTSILKKLFSINYDMSKRVSDYEITSGIINMIAHYRSFFWRTCNVTTKFFLVFSLNNSEISKSYFPPYNSTMNADMVRNRDKFNLIIENISLAETIIPYIPDACIVTGRFETAVIMHHIMKTEQEGGNSDPNIVITKDPVTMQIISGTTFIYRPKKYKGEDNSFVICDGYNGIYRYLADERKCKIPKFEVEISSQLYSMLLSMVGVKSRDMNSLVSYPTAINSLTKAIKSGKIINAYNIDIRNIYEEFDNEVLQALIAGGIDNRFKALDMYYQYGYFENSADRHFYKGIQNLYDPNGFHQICEEYFKACPIDTERL